MLLVLYCHSVLSIRSAFVVCYDFSPAIDGGSCCFFFSLVFPLRLTTTPSFERALFGRLDKSDFYRDYKTFNLFFYEQQTYFPGLRHKFHGRLRAARVQKNALCRNEGRQKGGREARVRRICPGSGKTNGNEKEKKPKKKKRTG